MTYPDKPDGLYRDRTTIDPTELSKAEPAHIQAVIGRGHPVAEPFPYVRLKTLL